jgi:DNA-binding CsgD family transcriptional regulator
MTSPTEDPEELDRLATEAFLSGDDAASIQLRTRAHTGFVSRGEMVRAAATAYWLAFAMLESPASRAQAGGWLARAQRLVDEANEPCAVEGWLLCAAGRQHASTRSFETALDAFTRAEDIGRRFGDRDLVALARHGQGRCRLMMNDMHAGFALLDELLVAIAGGEVGPVIAGVVYCSVISACNDLLDLRRAQEWTSALDVWCTAHPDIVAFRGYCLVRRSELMRLHGAWQDAVGEARRACGRLSGGGRPELGAAYYQLAEVHRLRGEFAEAEEAYRLGSQAGHKVHPGLALLRLGQGNIDAAETAIRRALQETRDSRSRVALLSAATTILLARNDVAGARAQADELEQIAARSEMPYPAAVAAQVRGAVALAEGQPLAALERLRAACDAWHELNAPYDLSQTRVLIARAYRELGDEEGAQLEFEAARDAFERLGAAPDVAQIDSLTAQASPPTSTALTGREVEVLRLIATGVTNRTIATRLGISEKTVARHISNIFTKLDLPSRAAATAYAYEHKLL